MIKGIILDFVLDVLCFLKESPCLLEIYTTNIRNDMISSICFKLVWEGESWGLDETCLAMSLMIF